LEATFHDPFAADGRHEQATVVAADGYLLAVW
jgi:hypothetical protein